MEKTIDVLVHKAKINLVDGESIGDFTRDLSISAKEYIKTAKGNEKDSYAYLIEAYSNKVVMSYYGSGKDKYYSVSYSRDKNGNFSFSNIQEVKRVTTFKPANNNVGQKSVKITKSKDENELLGWETVDVKKSFWGNLL